MRVLRRVIGAIGFSLLSVLALGVAPAAAAKSCKSLPVKVSLSSTDPTAFRAKPRATVKPSAGATVSSLRVTLVRGKRTYAAGHLAGTLARGRSTAVTLRPARTIGKGTYRLVASGKADGCDGTTRATRTWKFGNPALPVRAAPLSTLVGDNVTAVRLILRGVGGQRTAAVTAALRDAAGATVAEAKTRLSAGTAIVDLPLASPLQPGDYTLRLTGSAPGLRNAAPADQAITFAAGGKGAATPPVGNVSTAVVDWSGGAWQGREAAGFVAPGIGHGEIVCRPDAQYIRFYPDDLGREVAMLNWTYRDWKEGTEKSLREALHAPGTGADFAEGINKFAPPEKLSTGQFDGIITDRGPFGGPGGPPLAPPTTLKMTWTWDLSQPGKESCHVEATFTSQVNDGPPVVRSAQAVWRGDSNAPGRDGDAVDIPGLGRLVLQCQSGPDGTRKLTFDAPQGATVTTREGSDDAAVARPPGQITADLPNNGMLAIAFGGGQTALVTSRWKVNDPDGSQNWCFAAAQVVAPG